VTFGLRDEYQSVDRQPAN